jgi:monoterpene epsilon-lactone hydrolase
MRQNQGENGMASEDIKNVLAWMAANPAIEDLSIEEARVYFDGRGQEFPLPEGISIASVDVDGIAAEWVRAANANDEAVILYLHGGGYIIGSLASHRHITCAISQASGAAILAVDYRLAPEHPFPAAVEDAVTAYRWLLKQGTKANRIIIAGDSAGGGLTIATLITLRDEGVDLPAAGVCISPWVDLTNSSEGFTRVSDPMLTKIELDMMAQAYLQGQDAKTPLASPLFADLQGLPPLLIQVGTEEHLYDDSIGLEAQAKEAGVDANLEVWDEMIHVWHYFHPMLKEGREAITRIGEFVKAQIKV